MRERAREILARLFALERELEQGIGQAEARLADASAEGGDAPIGSVRQAGERPREEILESRRALRHRRTLSAPFISAMTVPIASSTSASPSTRRSASDSTACPGSTAAPSS